MTHWSLIIQVIALLTTAGMFAIGIAVAAVRLQTNRLRARDDGQQLQLDEHGRVIADLRVQVAGLTGVQELAREVRELRTDVGAMNRELGELRAELRAGRRSSSSSDRRHAVIPPKTRLTR